MLLFFNLSREELSYYITEVLKTSGIESFLDKNRIRIGYFRHLSSNAASHEQRDRCSLTGNNFPIRKYMFSGILDLLVKLVTYKMKG